MRKRLSSLQKWFLRPYSPLIRGMFVFRSGLRFLFRALEVPKPRVRKRSFSLTKILKIPSDGSNNLIFLDQVNKRCEESSDISKNPADLSGVFFTDKMFSEEKFTNGESPLHHINFCNTDTTTFTY